VGGFEKPGEIAMFRLWTMLAPFMLAVVHQPPRVRHVFIIVLENESYDVTFGPRSAAPYLTEALVAQGALLRNYYGIGHASLDNYIALISGQAPNEATQTDCLTFSDFRPARRALDGNGQAIGTGCVYPTSVRTIGDQLDSAGITWKGYMEDMGGDAAKEAASCGHPRLNAVESTTRSSTSTH
jgi:phosphatidylinositol-3-phosphatase